MVRQDIMYYGINANDFASQKYAEYGMSAFDIISLDILFFTIL
jgi:hypothetical protein